MLIFFLTESVHEVAPWRGTAPTHHLEQSDDFPEARSNFK